MEVSTFDNDQLGLSAFSKRLKKFIDVEHQFVQGSLVVALTAKYGFGKTTFLKMWKTDLESIEDKSKKPLVISLNAWESDYYGDPLFAIISSLVESLPKGDKSANSVVDAAKSFGWFMTAIGGQVVEKFTGIDAVGAGEFTEEKKAIREGTKNPYADTFSIYQGRKNSMDKLKLAIKEFVKSSESLVLFLVDELDRCRPDYAISYLETIKHIFDVQGAVFVLAADRKQLENSAKTAFGPDLDFEEYYRKFIHREIALPPIKEMGYRNLALIYVDYYLNRANLRNCFIEFNSDMKSRISLLISALKLTPRQIQDVFRILGHISETTEKNKGKLPWCIGAGSIAMATFKVGNSEAFHLFGTKQFEPEKAHVYLNKLLNKGNADWWFKVFLTGKGLKVDGQFPLENVLVNVGICKEAEKYYMEQDLRQFNTGWSDYFFDIGFTQIHEKIEQISQWE